MYQLLTFLTLTLLASATPLARPFTPKSHLQQRQYSSLSTLPFNLTYVFTAHLNLGSPNKPIPIPGGVLLTEPIANGTVTGPLINATVQGGTASPLVYSNPSVQVPQISLYGITSDGLPFYVEEMGIGTPSGQVTRITLSVNGTGNAGYQKLVDGFLLASVNPNSNGTKVEVQGWLVENNAMFAA